MARPYKAAPPEETVARALACLAKVGLSTQVETFVSGPPEFPLHACRVYLTGLELDDLRLRAEGKGTTAAYALASGHAELLERLQNGALMGFQLDPWGGPAADEAALRGPWLADQGGAPFLEVETGEVRSLSLAVLQHTGTTNGMCAGNTAEEALAQGMLELLERRALRAICLEGVTPPVVPRAEWASTPVGQGILALERRTGLKVEVRDLSLGVGLPVLGVVLWDEGALRYRAHVGAALDSQVALTRCLTELFQAGGQGLAEKFRPLELTEPASPEARARKRALEHYRCWFDFSGALPPEFFSAPPSYEPRPLDWPRAEGPDPFKADLLQLKALFDPLGASLFVRDVGFLGFPAYHVFSPELSRLYVLPPEALRSYAALFGRRATLVDLEAASPAEQRALAGALDDFVAWHHPELALDLGRFFFGFEVGAEVSDVALLFALWLTLDEPARAAQAFERAQFLLQGEARRASRPLVVLGEWARLRAGGLRADEATARLKRAVGEGPVADAMRLLEGGLLSALPATQKATPTNRSPQVKRAIARLAAQSAETHLDPALLWRCFR